VSVRSTTRRVGRSRSTCERAKEGLPRPKKVKEGLAYADYDAEGLLLGVELLGPCEVAVLDGVADKEPEPVRRFLKGGIPRGLVAA
jgi:hypothetical protein